ncbi:MAG: hypothetical protein K1X86_04220 [Ignavibacteria bacterium]|nr:hypothetical protein [Ignavibacteria bacterium]
MEYQKNNFVSKILPLLFVTLLLAGVYSCSNPSESTTQEEVDPGIMWTDETGRIIRSQQNDWTDWCYDTNIVTPLRTEFGAAYPNGTDSITSIPFSLAEKDTVSIYFLRNNDSLFVSHEEILEPGYYRREVNMYSFNFPKSYQRLYFKNRKSMSSPNQQCNKYGDILFIPRH